MKKRLIMTPIRYSLLLLLALLLAGAQGIRAQCTASAVVTDVRCNGLSDGSIDLTASNGQQPYTYLWSNGVTTEDLVGISAGTYSCTVTDALFCTSTVSASITEPTPLTINMGGIFTLNCIMPVIPLNATASGGTPPYNYIWSNGQTTNTTIVQTPGVYTVTVTDAQACTAVSEAVVVGDVNVPVLCTNPSPILTCAVVSATLDATCSSQGPMFAYQWSTTNGNIIGGTTTLTPTVNAPGVYTLIITNVLNGCTAIGAVFVEENIVIPTIDAGPNLELPCGTGVATLAALASGGPQFSFIWDGPNIVAGGTTLNPIVDMPGTYTITVTDAVNGCTASDTMEVTVSGSGLCSFIEGFVLQDTLSNCITDPGEPPLVNWVVKAESALGTFFALTDASGHYTIFVETGDTYAVSAINPNPLWEACPPIANVVVSDPNTSYSAADLLFKKLAGCPIMTVDISSGNLRRCFSTNFFNVSYCNEGTETAEDAYIWVTLDPLITPLSSQIPYSNLGNGVIQFNVGDVLPGQCGSLYFYAQISCSAVLGQTFCTEAHIYPDSSCIPPNALWSGASLQISSDCQSDSLRFQIKNAGTGNMPTSLDYVVIEDQVMLMSAPVQLDAGESTTVSVPANGSTWRLEVQQAPYHPGYSNPAVSVEGCTSGANFSTGFVDLFSPDDEDAFVDIDCKAVTGSYDPNDKQAQPKGYGTEHYIRPGTLLDYQIQFQNTGNDTAFYVRIVDTLSEWLDPSTIHVGSSSHPYRWDLAGAGVLSFMFDNILLPDSNVNEPASHGFIKFSIRPKADAPLETKIENTAEIYFDFNDPIVTNTTFHRLGVNFVTVGLWQPVEAKYAVSVTPNPFVDAATLSIAGLPDQAGLQLQVFDLNGQKRLEMETSGTDFQLKRSSLPAGLYLFNVVQGGKVVGNGKLVVQNR